MVSFRGARYSVPDRLSGSEVWVRATGDEVVVVAGKGSGASEVARHRQLPAGHACIHDEHYTRARHREHLHRDPKATNAAEAAFLARGEGAKLYLVEAGATGARRIEARMAEAVALASLHGKDAVDQALGTAAMVGRFGDGDLGSILVHAAGGLPGPSVPPEEHSLAAGTSGWPALRAGSSCQTEEDAR